MLNTLLFKIQIRNKTVWKFKSWYKKTFRVVPLFLQLIDGYAHYRVGGVNNTFKFDYLPVNDGKWHYLEVRWPRLGEIILVMDYGHWQVRLLAPEVTYNNFQIMLKIKEGTDD